MAQTGKNWYVLKTVSGKEAKVKEYIEAELKHNAQLSQFVSQVVIPMAATGNVWSRRKFLSLAISSLRPK